MKLLFLCGSRGEWGYIRPIIDICKKKKIDYSICLTNMVVLDSYGGLGKIIKKKNYKVCDEIEMALEGNNHYSMIKSLNIFGMNFVETLKREKPSWLIIAGDRGEQLIASIVAAYTYTPVAHIQAGEKSGNIDGVTRHGIARFVHFHFAANKDASNRLLRSGEEKFRIFNTGAPQLDEIYSGKISKFDILKKKLGIEKLSNYFVIVFHSVTEEYKYNKRNINELIKAVNYFDNHKIWILPNNDAGSVIIRNEIENKRELNNYIINNLPREEYLSLIKNAKVVVGNSSSGVIETPSFPTPSINIGTRQKDRIKALSTINSNYKKNNIIKNIKIAISKKFSHRLKKTKNPYGDGKASEKILDILKSTKIDDKLLVKKMTI